MAEPPAFWGGLLYAAFMATHGLPITLSIARMILWKLVAYSWLLSSRTSLKLTARGMPAGHVVGFLARIHLAAWTSAPIRRSSLLGLQSALDGRKLIVEADALVPEALHDGLVGLSDALRLGRDSHENLKAD